MAPSRPIELASTQDPRCRATARRAFLAARALARVLAALALAGGAAACSDSEPRSERMPVRTTGASSAVSTTRSENRALEVDLRVVSGPGGVFAFADVFIRGKGPFAFTVDTGASRSVVDWDLVKRLGIETIGEPIEVTGITCRGQARKVRLRGWRVGDVPLPRAAIQTIDMPEPSDGTAIDGLLGSDILSRFGAVTVNYTDERLVLHGRGTRM